MFKAPILQGPHNLSGAKLEFVFCDWLELPPPPAARRRYILEAELKLV
jgi:hypothetical protein